MVRRFSLAALLTVAMVLASGRAAAALERCSYGQTGGCCCKPPERIEEPAAQRACCCVPERLDACIARPEDPGPPPPSDSAATPDELPSTAPPDPSRGALVETDPFDPCIARYLLLASLRR